MCNANRAFNSITKCNGHCARCSIRYGLEVENVACQIVEAGHKRDCFFCSFIHSYHYFTLKKQRIGSGERIVNNLEIIQ